MPVTLDNPPPDTPSDASLAVRCQDGASVVDDRGRAIELHGRSFVVDDGRSRVERPLTDPSDPAYLSLPRVHLADGRALRQAAFEHWAYNLRDRLAGGDAWETTYLARKPYHTAFAILGATLLGGGSLWAVLRWGSADPQVRTQPGLIGGLMLFAAVALLLWVSFATLTSAIRYWLCRRGSFIRVDIRGVTLSRGARPRPPSDVEAVVHHPLLRVTELRLRGGGRVWVPREAGPLARLDQVLAALPGGPAADI